MQHRYVSVVFLGLLAFLGALAGCAEPGAPDRVVTTLGQDGYALFRVDGGSADRVAVIVEMRDAPPGTYVLLHTGNAPRSSGWFALDTEPLTPCREYGDDAVERAELDCLVADGRGELVDIITVGDDMILLPPVAAEERKPARGPASTLMRHEMCGCAGCQCSYSSSSSSSTSSSSSSRSGTKVSKSDYYAVMRIEGGLVAPDADDVRLAIEVRPFGDDDENAEPTVTQIQ